MFITGIKEHDKLDDDCVSRLGEGHDEATLAQSVTSIVTLSDREQYLEKYGSKEDELSPEVAQKYFGAGARYRFYQRQRWMYNQRFNSSHKGASSLPGTLFDNEYEGPDEFPNYDKSDKELFGFSSDEEASVGDGDSVVSDISETPGSIMTSVTSAQQRQLDLMQFPNPETAVEKSVMPLSPRTKYIDNCLKNGVNPRAGMMVRKQLTKQLSLQGAGIGDKAAVNLAASLSETPLIHSINLRDNRLTDEGMKPILDVLTTLPSLVELDLSQNEIGEESSAGLAAYLGREDCPLLKLVLSKADVDDGECEGFISALQTNKTLKEIDLSNNLLGSAEVLNTVMPDLTTGAEAIAEWLRTPTCVLEKLILSWNMIRLESAVDLCSSLNSNASLTYLDLSYNSLGHDGGLALGDAIMDNKSLRTLNVDNNNIDACACFTICVGVIENLALTKLSINGNPIGEQGAQALILVPMTVGDRVKVSAKNCNILIRDKRCWFDIRTPCRTYSLTLSHPFERAVSFMLCRIAATHPTYIFKDVGIAPVDSNMKPGLPVALDLIQTINRDMVSFMDATRKQVVAQLRKVVAAAADINVATQLFHDTDVDGSGELDAEELKLLLDSIGIAIDEKGIHAIMSAVDVDGGGVMDEVEFFVFLRSIGRDAQNKLKDLLEVPVLTIRGKPSGTKYAPPHEGLFVAEIVDGFVRKPIYRNISSCDNNYAKELAKESGEAEAMIGHALSHGKVRYEEAFDLYKALFRETRNVVSSLQRVMPQVTDPVDARNLVLAATDGDKKMMLQVKGAFGPTLRPLYGNYNGYYMLDLSKDLHRTCLSRLFENSARRNGLRSVEFMRFVGQGAIGDTSRNGDWSSFRNGAFNREPCEVSPKHFTPMPLAGKLEFDYSCVERPWQIDTALLDASNEKNGTSDGGEDGKERESSLLSEAGAGTGDVEVTELGTERGARPKSTAIANVKFVRLLRGLGLLKTHEKDESGAQESGSAIEGAGALKANNVINARDDDDDNSNSSYGAEKDEGEAVEEDPFILEQVDRLIHWHDDRYEEVSMTRGKRRLIADFFECSTEKSYEVGSAVAELYAHVPKRTDELLKASDREGIKVTIGGKNGGLRTRSSTAVDVDEWEKGNGTGSGDNGGAQDTEEERTAAVVDGAPAVDVGNILEEVDIKKKVEEKGEELTGEAKLAQERANLEHLRTHLDEIPYEHEGDDLPQEEETNVKGNGKVVTAAAAAADDDDDNLADEDRREKEMLAEIERATAKADGNVQSTEEIGDMEEDVVASEDEEEDDAAAEAMDDRERLIWILDCPNITVPAKAFQVVQLLEEVLSKVWLTTAQVALLMECFIWANIPRATHFGSYRVELLVSLYCRILDIENMEVVTKELSGYEVGCLYARIGYLNIFNPMKPDGAWELNLAIIEERIMAKIFCQLAVVEPGDNWSAGQFRWEREMDPMPGWELTQGWMSESGMPQKGIINLCYYSGDKQGLKGCKPAVNFRRALLAITLCDEREMFDDCDTGVDTDEGQDEKAEDGEGEGGDGNRAGMRYWQRGVNYLMDNRPGIMDYILKNTAKA